MFTSWDIIDETDHFCSDGGLDGKVGSGADNVVPGKGSKLKDEE